MSEDRERARAAALGQPQWGTWGSALHHQRYVMPIDSRSRRRCNCGCGKRATHVGCANGLGMTSGCELSMRRWAHETPHPSPARRGGHTERT